MKFFEFNKYEYYALIFAQCESDAIKIYKDIVADIPDVEEQKTPDILTEGEALNKFLNSDIENCDTDEEKTKLFNYILGSFNSTAEYDSENVLLVDKNLF